MGCALPRPGPCALGDVAALDEVHRGGMVLGMATTKVTITLANEQLAAVKKLVADGKAANVSSFIQHAVAVSLADVAGWGTALAQALQRTGGPLTAKERSWADSVLGIDQPRKRRRKAA